MERTATRPESLLRPREIQVRIRAGQTPETVAAAAQTSVERVMVFATPVLAERGFVAQQAARASVRRRVGDGPVGLLGEAVSNRLESVGLDAEAAEWDAWRREDGRWTVEARWVESGEDQRAQFTYDAMGRYAVAEDDAARWLVGERRSAGPARTTDPLTEDAAQLALGDDALQVVTGRPLTAVRAAGPLEHLAPQQTAAPVATTPSAPSAPSARADAEPTEDLTETVRAVRAVAGPSPDRAPVPTPAPVVEHVRVEHVRVEQVAVDQVTVERVAVEPIAVEPIAVEPAAVEGAAQHPADGSGDESSGGEALFGDSDLRARPSSPARRTPRSASGSRTRRSMPSWDDIMLGSAPRGD